MKKTKRERLEAVVDKWLGDLAAEAEATAGVSVRHLLMTSVGRVVVSELEATGDIVSDGAFRAVREKYERGTLHIRDWLVGAVIRHDAWLDRVNADGVPLKLAKSGRFEQIVDEANKAMRKLNSRGVATSIDSEVVHEFANGYRIVRLNTSAELEAESAMMQHCVGQGAYHGAVEAGLTGIYSLRDPAGKAHVTIEVDVGQNSVEQVKGKQNDIPRRDYFAMVTQWLNMREFEFGCNDHPTGFAVDRSGKLVDIAQLSEGTVFNGVISIDCSENSIPHLPENLTVTGDFLIHGPKTEVFVAPRGLTVGGNYTVTGLRVRQEEPFPGQAIYLDKCVIERLPENIAQTITITSSVFAPELPAGTAFERLLCISASSEVKRLLEGATFRQNLDIDSQTCLHIPDAFKVDGGLKISRSTIFFDGTVDVGGLMLLNHCRVEGDAKRICVGSTFHAHRSKLRKLPDDMRVGSDMTLSSVDDMTEIPAGVSVGGKFTIDNTGIETLNGRKEFNSDVVLHRTSVATLEPGTVVRGSLSVRHLPMERLPANLTVTGDLSIGNCPIKRLPHSAQIGGNISLKDSFVVAIPEGFHVRGNLDISGIASFLIAKGVTIDGALLAGGSGLEQLPSDLQVHSIVAPSSRLESLPKGLNLEGDLDVRKTHVRAVPDGMVVGGWADFRNTAIQLVPATVFVGGELRVEDHVVIDCPVGEPRRSYPRFG
ncbi:hypothetical protein HFN89_03880 [Rhizobium laguerreae]|nr:hypothetical protein [Rhizobium laguerreae]